MRFWPFSRLYAIEQELNDIRRAFVNNSKRIEAVENTLTQVMIQNRILKETVFRYRSMIDSKS
jgi:hypothetical protein